jgi:hypothetical protein
MKFRTLARGVSALACGAMLLGGLGCRKEPDITGGTGGTPGTGGRSATGGTGGTGGGAVTDAGFVFMPSDGGGATKDGGGPCVNLCQRQMQCAGGKDTTLSGTVFAPTPPKFGMPDPVYNAIVYVPNATVEPFKMGVTCETCGLASGSPLVTALTGADGKFTLKNVPVGDNVPLVIQVGRWRRQVVILKVNPCVDNPLTPEQTRLPRNKMEGDIPLTALATGNADAIECVLRKIGVDDSEFTLPSGNGRIRMYQVNGAQLGPMTPLYGELTSSVDSLKRYDIVILECEGMPNAKPLADKQNVVGYSEAGGRLFLTHYSYSWAFDIAPFAATATWVPDSMRPTANNAPITATIDQSFPKGKAFAEWLLNVKATAPMPGQIQIAAPRHDLNAVMPPAQRWVYTDAPATVQHYTFNTPVGVAEDKQCGRVLFSDFHVNDIGNVSLPFPTECNDLPMTPQEKVLEFMLFDLASCVQPDSKPPVIP